MTPIEKLAEIATIAFDPDTITALEYGMIGAAGPYEHRTGISKDEAIGYATDALRDIRTILESA